jgi:hypothetical protein
MLAASCIVPVLIFFSKMILHVIDAILYPKAHDDVDKLKAETDLKQDVRGHNLPFKRNNVFENVSVGLFVAGPYHFRNIKCQI